MRPRSAVGRADGFILIELLIAVAIIGIVAAIAVPAISRARAAALERSAVGLLRTINSGQASYAATCAQDATRHRSCGSPAREMTETRSSVQNSQ